ncbi:MAG: hypothetical protein E7581_02435 [Ruminococcaceae bacterium]|nr:hypothetical protein [Oscillospiraceae bacterium]
MRTFGKMLLSSLLALAMLVGMAACTVQTPEQGSESQDTTVGEDATQNTEETTQPDQPDQPTEVVKAQRELLSFDEAVTITTEGDFARVTHAEGLSYLASGYTSIEGNVLHFFKGVSLVFDSTDDVFNRITLGYVSTQPLHGTVTYSVDGQSVTDDFYLEAGKDTFSCLISQYLDGKKGQGVTKMHFESCNGQSAEFALCVMVLEDYPVYGNATDTYYIENDRYKLGIRLGWGGGIDYLLDKQCPIEGLGNLVNQADTGRLVQQSYYGVVRNGEFEPGEFNGSEWCYNPVQGGDKYLHPGRIIDVVVTENSMYIKAQPLDWAKDNYLTPSYMENVYTIYEDRVLVDNRFVDFSNWTHRMAQQELPAFYTVSHLSVFSFYNGTNPWTNDTLSYRHDLNFWGDYLWAGDCTFRLRLSNTETWCAWTSPEHGYGFGLYVPGVDCFKAGCYQYNNSMDSEDFATNYVAPLKNILIKSFEPIEYSYMMATGSLPELRALFTEHRDFTANEGLYKNSESIRIQDEFTVFNEYYYGDSLDVPEREPENNQPIIKTEPVLDLTAQADLALLVPTSNTLVKYDSAEKGTRLIVTGDDPHVTVAVQDFFNAKDYKTLEIVYMLPKTNSQSNNVIDLFFCVGDVKAPNANAMIRASLIADGEYHTLTVDLTGKSFWQGDIHSIRIDYLDQCQYGDEMFVKLFALK